MSKQIRLEFLIHLIYLALQSGKIGDERRDDVYSGILHAVEVILPGPRS